MERRKETRANDMSSEKVEDLTEREKERERVSECE